MSGPARPQVIYIEPPVHFSFTACLPYLARSANECLHAVEGGRLIRPLSCGDVRLLLAISCREGSLAVTCLN